MGMLTCDVGILKCDAAWQGFVEIHTPKIIAGASEGGAEVFRLKYMEGTRFEQPVCA